MGQRQVAPTSVHTCGEITAPRIPLQITVFCPRGGRCYAGRRVGDGRIRASVEDREELSAENLWEEISGRLREALSSGTYSKWFGDIHGLALEGDTLVLTVPTEFTRDWIEGHFRGLIGAAVRDILGFERPLEVRVDDSGEQSSEGRAEGKGVVPMVQRLPGRPESGGFNVKYTFDSFVIGSSNRFAHAAA